MASDRMTVAEEHAPALDSMRERALRLKQAATRAGDNADAAKYRAELVAIDSIRAALRDAGTGRDSGEVGERVRHVKRGTEYDG